MSETRYPPMIIMGVQGSGKSTIGAALAERLNIDFIDDDDLHPKANKDKMAGGQPLTDEDSIEDGTDAWQALTGMLRAKAGRVLVLHEGRIRGVLTRDRMLAWLKVSGD